MTWFFCTRKLVKYPGERDIRIFKLLSKYIKDPLLARKFVDILLPFIAKKTKNPCKYNSGNLNYGSHHRQSLLVL